MNFITRLNIKRADYFERKRLNKLFATFKSKGRNVHFCKDSFVTSPSKLEVGDNVWVGEHFLAHAEGGISIGSGTIISSNVEIWTQNHNYDGDDLTMIPYDKNMVKKPVSIGENVWIGTRVIIVPGAQIGEGAVVGAGSVVTGSIPAFAVCGGNPAKVIKYRNVEKYKELKAEGKIYLDMEYDYDKSSLRKSEY